MAACEDAAPGMASQLQLVNSVAPYVRRHQQRSTGALWNTGYTLERLLGILLGCVARQTRLRLLGAAVKRLWLLG